MKNEGVTPQLIGARIKTAREADGLSQLDLAKQLGFGSATAISLIESGERNVSIENLEKMTSVLHRDVKYFLGQDESKNITVEMALRADKDLTNEDQKAILRFVEMAKNRKK